MKLCRVNCPNHPGEVHETRVSFIDQRTNEVRLVARHVATGECCEVGLGVVMWDEKSLDVKEAEAKS